MTLSFIKKSLLTVAFIALPSSLFAIEGLWHLQQLEAGWKEWQKHHPNPSKFTTISHSNEALVRLSPNCSGFFVSSKGHIVTSYSCILKSLEEFAYLGQMDLDQDFAATAIESAPFLSPLNQVFHQVDAYDMSAEMLAKIKQIAPSDRYQHLQQRAQELAQSCQAKQRKHRRCRVQAINEGSSYLMVIENTLEAKLLFAPKLAQGIQSKYVGLGTDGLNEIELPVLLQAVDPAAKELRPYQPQRYLTLSPSKTQHKDPVFTVSYSNIYKRYINRKGVEGNLIPSQGFLDHIEVFAKKLQGDWQALFQKAPTKKYPYLDPFLYRDQWNYRLGIHGDEDKSVQEFLAEDLKFRAEFKKYFDKEASPEEKAYYYQILAQPDMAAIPNTANLMQYTLMLCRPSILIRELRRKAKGDKDYDSIKGEHELELRRNLIDPEVSSYCYNAVFEGFRIHPESAKGLDQQISALLKLEESIRLKKIQQMIAASVLLRPALSTKSYDTNMIKNDRFLSFFTALENHLISLKDSEGKLTDFYEGAHQIYTPYLEKYLANKSLFYFPGMSKKGLQVYGFGDIIAQKKAKDGSIERFATSIDSGFRNMRGAPTYAANGDLIGMFWATDYKRRPLLNFYYKYEEAYAIHLSADAIIETLSKSSLPPKTLRELGI